MKGKILLLVSLLSLVLYSCDDDSKVDVLELSTSSFNDISSDGSTLKVDITCTGTWTAYTNAKSWCTVTPQTGVESQMITIQVAANLDTTPREATVTVSCNGVSKEIKVNQQAASAPTNLETYHYRLPVIFHVLYKDKSDPLQYVSHSRLAKILEIVNTLYQGSSKSPDMNVTFTLAATDPNGKTLDTPGVEYIARTEYPIDCMEFMNDGKRKYTSLLWDPNKYINVMIYNFAPEEGTNLTTLGISHLPFSVNGKNYLEGLNGTEYTHLELENLAFAYCVSINSLFINEQSNATQYKPADVTVTVAHELGHYLGLYHTFAEDEEGGYLNGCADTDYCEDTPTYNRVLYSDWVSAQLDADVQTRKELSQRENCKTGEKFLSTNIMDYEYGYTDRFTHDQYSRIRHVLLYSPLIPGPKKDRASTRTAHEGVLDLPIRVMK